MSHLKKIIVVTLATILPLFVMPVSASSECSSAPGDIQSANIRVVQQASNNNFNKKSIEKMGEFMNTQRYIQHTPNGADGIEHLAKFIAFLKEKMPSFRVAQQQVIAENDLVMTQSIDYVDGKAIEVSVDWYRVHFGKITEHWDVVAEFSDPKDSEEYIAGLATDKAVCMDKELLRSHAIEFVYQYMGKHAKSVDSTKSVVHGDLVVRINDSKATSTMNKGEFSQWVNSKRSSAELFVEIARVIVMNNLAAVHFKWTVNDQPRSATMVMSFDQNQKITESWLALLPIPKENNNFRDPVF